MSQFISFLSLNITRDLSVLCNHRHTLSLLTSASLSCPLLHSPALCFSLLISTSISSSLLHSPALCFFLLTPVALRTYTLRLVTNAYVFFPSWGLSVLMSICCSLPSPKIHETPPSAAGDSGKFLKGSRKKCHMRCGLPRIEALFA